MIPEAKGIARVGYFGAICAPSGYENWEDTSTSIYLWYPQAQLRSSNDDATSGSFFLCEFPPAVYFPMAVLPRRYLTLLDYDSKRTDSGRIASYISQRWSPPETKKRPQSARGTPAICPQFPELSPILLCCALHLIGFGWLHRVGENLVLASALQRPRSPQHGTHTTILSPRPLAEATRPPLTLPCSSLHRIHSHPPQPWRNTEHSETHRAKAASSP